MRMLVKEAYAKINLVLDVLGRRPDGYHDVSMVMQNISICDTLTFCADIAADTDIRLSCSRSDIPLDGQNLVYKAVQLMFEHYGITGHISIDIDKHIPVEAGMAGGSTDCAATLHAINELYDIGAADEELMRLGVRLGADVPYCVMARTALSEGIGELLTPVQGLGSCYILIAKPPAGVSTGQVYECFDTYGVDWHPDVRGMVLALEKNDIYEVAAKLGNVLEVVTMRQHPEIAEIKKIMSEQGALNAVMTGSGPTVFGLYKEQTEAENAGEIIKAMGLSDEVYVAEPVN